MLRYTYIARVVRATIGGVYPNLWVIN